MAEPRLISVKPLEDYRIILTYETAERRVFDVRPYIKGSWYGMLKDLSYFKSVHLSDGTAQWAGGQDLAPHELYDDSIPLDAESKYLGRVIGTLPPH